MELSLVGLIGALFGLVIGVLDFGLVAMVLRRALDKSSGSAGVVGTPRARELVMKVAFAVNALVFAGLGYWFGVAMAG